MILDNILFRPLVEDMDGFKHKLSQLYNWNEDYIDRLIIEYKKFLYLGTIQSVNPSWEIDQMWHLHLQYTKEYWNVWCKEILKIDFHHNPEPLMQKSPPKRDNYIDTVELYISIFNENPPSDIWTQWKKKDNLLVDLNTEWVIPIGNFKFLTKIIINYVYNIYWNRCRFWSNMVFRR